MLRKTLLAILILGLIFVIGCNYATVDAEKAYGIESKDKTLPPGCNNDGNVDPGEQCDDGNWFENDKCDRCTSTVCGDGIINLFWANSNNEPEACDPGEPGPDGLIPETGMTPQEWGNRQCLNTTGKKTACHIDSCKCVGEVPYCGNNVLEGGPTPAGVWRGEQCDAPGNFGDLQCFFLGLGTTCNKNTCICSGCNFDGNVDAGEQCDDGNFIPNDACDACVKTVCGDGMLDNNPKNSQGITEECGEPGANCPAGEVCKNCVCMKQIGGNQTNKTQPPEDEQPAYCKANGVIDAGEDCDPGDPARGIQGKGCSQDQYCDWDCKCKEMGRPITPRCGDGYISAPWMPGGGNEECDTGGRNNAPLKPDTCPSPKTCVGCKCVLQDEEVPACTDGTEELQVCKDHCDREGGECVWSHTNDEGTRCYNCEVPECPTGQVDDEDRCNDLCPGTCEPSGTAGLNTCYECMTYSCPTGTIANKALCEKQCPYGDCEVAAEEGDLSCYKCVENCDTYCEGQGYSTSETDWTSYILGEIEGVSCVSSVQLYIPGNLEAGNCYCYNTEEPSITFDTTPPVCTGTVCGDVTCGDSAECDVDTTHYVVSCNWQGWKNIGKYQWVPLVGGS